MGWSWYAAEEQVLCGVQRQGQPFSTVDEAGRPLLPDLPKFPELEGGAA
jgi:hypothetical protein